MCIECTSNWLSNLDVPSLKAKSSSVRVQCPSVNQARCCGSISHACLKSQGLDSLTVDELLMKSEMAVAFWKEDILEAIAIRCPRVSCGILLDLNPDACAAMSCNHCGQHFCACCHARFASSRQAHLHIPLAHDWRDVFLPREMVLEGQRRLRLLQLRDVLDSIQSNEIRQDMLDVVSLDLQGLGLPTAWSEIIESSNAAREISGRERLGDIVPNLEQQRGDPDMNLVEENANQTRGMAISELCLQRKFDQVRILLAEFQRETLHWEVDWFRRAPDGNNAFNLAARMSDSFHCIACMQLLIELGAGATINEVDCDNFTALQRFVMLNDIQCVKFILDQEGLDIEAQTAEGRTALYLCAEMRFLHIARELLRRGAYLHTSDHSGSTVLMAVAVRLLHEEAAPSTAAELVRNLQFWISSGVDVEVPDGQAVWRALHYAAAGRYDAAGDLAVRTLLQAGAQINARTRFNQSPLMLAACFGNIAAMKLLVAAEGNKPSIPFDSSEPLLLNAAVENRREEITAALKEAQGWELFKVRARTFVTATWSSYSFHIMCGVGVCVVAIVIFPFWSYFKDTYITS